MGLRAAIIILVHFLGINHFSNADTLEQDNQAYETLVKFLKTNPKKDTTRINALNELGWSLRNSDPEQGIKYLKEGLAIADSLQLPKHLTSLYNRIGVLHRNTGDLGTATFYYNKAVELAESLGNEKELAYSSLNIANIYLLQKDYFKTITHASRGLKYFTEFTDPSGSGYARSLMGEAYMRLGNYKQALEFLRESYAIRERAGDMERKATSARLLGLTFLEMENFSESEKYLLEALRIQERFENYYSSSLIYVDLGLLEYRKGNFAKAEDYLKSAFKEVSFNQAQLWEYEALKLLGEVYSAKGDYLKAFNAIVRADSIRELIYTDEKRKELEKLMTNYELSDRDRENQLLLKDQLIQQNFINQQRQRVIFLSFFGLFMIFLGAILLWNRRKIRNKNQLLKESNQILEETQEELIRQKEILEEQANEINLKNEELIELNKEKDSLMGVVAHDLRTPLANIDGLSFLLKDAGLVNKEQSEYLELIRNVAKNGINLINDLLVLNKLESGTYEQKQEEIEVSQLLRNILLSYQITATEKNIKIELIEDYYKKGIIRTDEAALRRIIENLLSNALKFSPPFTRVIIDVKEEPFYFEFIVKDQGPGIKEEDIEFLFKKFHRLSNKPTAGEPSTGLGLSIVKALVLQLRGEVKVESTYGSGSEFKIILPK